MGPHHCPAAASLFLRSLMKRAGQRLAGFVAGKGFNRFHQRSFSPRRNIDRVQAIASLRNLLVLCNQMREQPLEQRDAVDRELSPHGDNHLIDGLHKSVIGLFFEKAILVTNHLLVITPYRVVAFIHLSAQRVQRGPPPAVRPFYQVEVVRRKNDRRNESLQIDRPFRLPIEPILARTTIKREIDIKTPIAVSCLHGYATMLLTVANQLIGRTMSERRERRKQLDGLDEVRFADSVLPHKYGDIPKLA